MGTIYLDLETTGIKHDTSIIEIAAEYHVNGSKVTSFDAKCFDPDSIVLLEALNVNKTRFVDLKSRKTEKDALMIFFDWLLDVVNEDTNLELSGVNIQFDSNFLAARAKKYSINIDGVLPYRLHDIGQESRLLIKHGLLEVKKSPGKGNSLKDLCSALGIEVGISQLHTAVGDVALYPLVQAKLTEILNKSLGK